MTNITEFIEAAIGIGKSTQFNILKSIFIILLYFILRIIVNKILHNQIQNKDSRYIWKKTVNYILVGLGLLMIVIIWFRGFQTIVTFLGLIAAGIAIALKDVLTSLVGWLFIIFKKPFTIGDRIEVGETAGDIIDIRLFQFSIMEIGGERVDAEQSTGRVIHIPNSKIFTKSLANYNAGFRYIWNEIPVLITFESSWKKAKSILNEVVKKHAEQLSEKAEQKIIKDSEEYMIHYDSLSPTVYTSIENSGVLLTLRYLIKPKSVRDSELEMWEEILDQFGQHDDIEFAYPTTRFYNKKEGTQND